jgi:hypothetical protein
MRTPSTPTGNAIAATNTAPAYLVQIGWSTVTRLTTPTRSTTGAATSGCRVRSFCPA